MKTDVSGFTILELLTVITVLAVLLGIGIPSLTSVMRQNRIAAQTNELAGALALARSEAVKRGARVTVCSSNGDQCANSTNWGSGWLLFSDTEGAIGSVDADGTAPDDVIIQRWKAPTEEMMQLTATRATLSYLSSGGTDAVTAFTVFPQSCSGTEARTITVSAAGRASKATSVCP